ncbi:ABC transporter ATP-binding protein [Ruania alba]|uniref:Iron complex transport system ATP-binding protein n=1 Tax=Ruania alba TaxID=648782 RepID=A0A1H5MAX1_9MICO|nr:ABC transporter ATP-binding protein [Ruania alba]SEE86446.1 iron complex transport system ATP-binding protein [Ruania alba]
MTNETMDRTPIDLNPTAQTAARTPAGTQVRVEGLRVGYAHVPVLDGVDLTIPTGAVTAIVGPNGCGKSTLLRAMARVLTPQAGAVVLDGRPVHRMPTKTVARMLGLLPQSNVVPEQLTVRDLVQRGRYPHRGAFARWSPEDQRAVDDALRDTGTTELADRPVDELSGGQQQRAWVAMVLAQRTPVLLLDEPTTYLDLAHRLEILRLLRRLNAERRVTVAMVLHDLDEACRYADHVVAMRDGEVVAAGPPRDVVTPAMVEAVFGVPCTTVPDPVTGTPIVVPLEEEHPGPP